MAERWFAVCRRATGELVSSGTVVADPIPEGLEAILLAAQPDWAADEWDAATRTVMARAAEPARRDRVDDIMAEPEFLALNLLSRDATRAALVRNLSDDALRYYKP